ncbi:methylated-DNA--[protein]-cysteine S-methyltransferase [Sneathiella chungangensis]|uniref:methylated-DNA--[protein]-cysteine S-methyltransferase n=1 Tax=Sneathiella chungangensis TaxID=1418234 RepID=A0A845MIJ8_9PROT|nr:methylated-DNA--[protein]-cysteine S-methyltransferase [Sneathiella chungangensis]MZR23117.1 methylated-DNA--[protein]-cysteine S-methyltransferase [Sneathiella chungangensis]
MTQDAKLNAVMARDKDQDGQFVYGVKTTGIYCRPSCPARNPKAENIRFFDLPEIAEAAGFRACRRCRPDLVKIADPSLSLTRQICRIIERHVSEQSGERLSLGQIAEETGYSEDHLSRSFKKVLGISPMEYYDNRRTEVFKDNVKAGESVSAAAYGAGFGSTSRLYEKAHARLGMTPASYAKGGAGAEIAYAFADCFLGQMLVAGTRHGVCAVYFGDNKKDLIRELEQEFYRAEIAADVGLLADWSKAIVDFLQGASAALPEIPLDMYGTAFQRRVWQALLEIGPGRTKTYRQLAEDLGAPKSARAVGRACATNPVSLIVPCHRVIGTDGKLHGYRWGLERKEALRNWETAD